MIAYAGEDMEQGLMWDLLLYICCFYGLMSTVVWANGLAEYSQAENLNTDIERVSSIRNMPCSC